jgi:serine/threonine protein kinase
MVFIVYLFICTGGDSISTTSITREFDETFHRIIYLFHIYSLYNLQTFAIVLQLTRIEYVHHCKLIHRDLKPENILIGRPRQTLPFKESAEDTIYLIDFGMAKTYIDKTTKNHIQYNTEVGVFGTYQFMSANGHLGIGKKCTHE